MYQVETKDQISEQDLPHHVLTIPWKLSMKILGSIIKQNVRREQNAKNTAAQNYSVEPFKKKRENGNA